MSNSLGEKIRRLRKEKDLTIEQLAEQTDSSKGYIWELENRDTRKPSAEKLIKIAAILNVDTEFLLDDSKDTPDDNVLEFCPLFCPLLCYYCLFVQFCFVFLTSYPSSQS